MMNAGSMTGSSGLGHATPRDAFHAQQQGAQMKAAQAQAAVNHGYADASDRPQTVLEVAEQQAQSTTRSLTEIVGRLTSLKERAFGAGPESGANAAAEPQPSGAVARFGRAIQPHDMLIAHIYVLINELDRLA